MASAPPNGDPRVAKAAGDPGEIGVAPRVVLPRADLSPIVVVIGMIALGLVLFSVLDARRRGAEVPAVRVSPGDRAETAVAQSPPPLFIPPAVPLPAPVAAAPIEPPRPLPPQNRRSSTSPSRRRSHSSSPSNQKPRRRVPATLRPSCSTGPAAAIPPQRPPGATRLLPMPGLQQAATPPPRLRAHACAPAFWPIAATRAAGTLIPGVLETGLGFDPPRPRRAIVSSDVRGFDGSKILIPRGSRLIGEYRSEAQPGQNRALVNWVRLIRPDGVTIAIGSPASDPLGRGGLGARVNNHFFERFTGAILQSALDIGVNVASRSSGSPVILALPGVVQNTAQPLTQRQEIVPTLTVKPATSITIFVARDLDFSGAETRR